MIHKKPDQNDSPHFRDIDFTDFRDIVDFLSVCQGPQLEDDKLSFERDKKIGIVRGDIEEIQVDGKLAARIRTRLDDVPQDHPFIRDQGFTNWGRKLQLSQYIEIPLYACRPDIDLRPERAHQDPESLKCSWWSLVLQRFLDPKDTGIHPASGSPLNSQDEGTPSPAMNSKQHAGYENTNHLSIALARGDRKDLQPLEVDALAFWIMEIVNAKDGRSLYCKKWEDRDDPKFWPEERYAQLFTKEGYHTYWHEERKKRRWAGDHPCGGSVWHCPYCQVF